jgi:Mrp family chromosome partitioning ATPase
LHEPFDFAQSPGLVELAQKKVSLKDAVRASRTSNLYVLPTGEIPGGSPLPLLQPLVLGPVFEQLKNGYDFTIVDTPPALRYPDALQIARLTNGAILVLPAEGTPRRAETEVRRRLQRAEVRVLGIVINRIALKEAVRSY